MAARGYGLTPLVHRGYHGPASQRGGRRGERLPHTERSRGRTPIQLIDLRRLVERHADADETGRHYTHRFVVRGHWRSQPHGPGRSQIRLQFIEPHIKGPAGAQLLTTREHVNVWRR